MGWKGPLVILLIGVAGLSGLGMMADMVLRNPQAKAVITVRHAMIERYGVQDIQLSPRGRRSYLTVWVRPSNFEEGTAGALPPAFESLPEFFAANFEEADIPASLHVEFRSSIEERTISRHRVDLSRTRPAIRRKLKKLLGGSVELSTDPGSILVVRGPGSDSSRAPERAARIAAHYQGDSARGEKWSEIRVELGSAVHRFDGAGRVRK